MTNKIFHKKSVVVLAIIATILFFIQPFFTWFVADDFCYMLQIQKEGVFSRMWQDYITWDGRCISLTYPFSRLGLYFGIYWFGPLLASLTLLITMYLVVKNKTSNIILSTLVITFVFWLASFNFLSQTLYWSTATGYILDISMLYWAYLLFTLWKGTTKQYLLAIPVYFYAGTASPGGVIGLLFVLVLSALYEKRMLKKINTLQYILPLSLIITGFLMVILSPGNSNRLVGMDKANLTHIWTIYFNIKLTFSKLWEFNTPFVWGLFSIGLMGAIQRIKQSDSYWQTVIQFLFYNKWLLAAIISVVFFIPFPGLNSPRTNIHFVFFVLLYAVEGFIYLRSHESLNYVFVHFAKRSTFIVFIVVACSQLFDANYSKKKIEERHVKLKSLKGQAVILTTQDRIIAPGTRRFEDVSNDSSYWLNRCVASYYGLEYIKGTKDKNDN